MAALRTTRLSIARCLALGLFALGLFTLGQGAAVPWLVQAAEPCAWRQPLQPSRLFLDGQTAVLRRYYDPRWWQCAAPKGGSVNVEWRAGRDALSMLHSGQASATAGGQTSAPVQTEALHLDTDPPFRVQASLTYSQVCPHRSGPGAKFAVTGLPGHEQVSELVPVRARVVASGSLAPLAFDSPPLEFPCRACEFSSASRLQTSEDSQGNVLIEAELDPVWFECARRDATLTLRAFQGQSQAQVLHAIRPQLELRELEKQLTRRGQSYVLRKLLPKSRLCSGAPYWAFEFWGRGELMRAADGQRTAYHPHCSR